MTNNRTILITGQQGGAVARALKGTLFHLRGLTRKPDGERAAALVRRGIDIGRLLEEGTIRPDVATVYGLQDAAQAWKDIAGKLPGVHGISLSEPGTVKRRSHGKIVLRVPGLDDQIRVRAYELYLVRGAQPGRELEDCFRPNVRLTAE